MFGFGKKPSGAANLAALFNNMGVNGGAENFATMLNNMGSTGGTKLGTMMNRLTSKGTSNYTAFVNNASSEDAKTFSTWIERASDAELTGICNALNNAPTGDPERIAYAISQYVKLRVPKMKPPLYDTVKSAVVGDLSVSATVESHGTRSVPASDTYIRFTCPCGKRLKAESQYAGKKTTCVKCKKKCRIPVPEVESVESVESVEEVIEEICDLLDLPPAPKPALPPPPPAPVLTGRAAAKRFNDLSNTEDQYEAERNLKAAIAADPTFDIPYCNLGHLLCKQGRYEDARPNLEKAIKLGTPGSAAHNQSTILLKHFGSRKQSRSEPLPAKPDIAELTTLVREDNSGFKNMNRIRDIGEVLNREGGIELMRKYFYDIRNKGIYFSEDIWDGIGDWRS